MVVAVVAVIWPMAGLAAEPMPIGKFSDWSAYTFDDEGGKICYIVSEPQKNVGNYTQRGDIYFLVTHRTAGNVFNEVSIITGYTYKERSEPEAIIDQRKKFRFYTDGDAAWVESGVEADLVKAMRAGNTMMVKGTSSRGTLTTDTYSLSGVSAALNKIDAECGRK